MKALVTKALAMRGLMKTLIMLALVLLLGVGAIVGIGPRMLLSLGTVLVFVLVIEYGAPAILGLLHRVGKTSTDGQASGVRVGHGSAH